MSSPDNPHTDNPRSSAPRAEREEAEHEHAALTVAPSPESVEAGHETSDVNIRGILWLAALTVLGTAIVQVGLWLLLSSYHVSAERSDPDISPLAEPDAKPPGPHLQSTPIRDYEEFRAQQETRLNSYGWADGEQKAVHIPVERAIDLLLERGLPEPSGTSAAEAGSTPPPEGNESPPPQEREEENVR